MDLLRIATAGSVDDGKSTLIGRLLYDSKAIHEDQLQAIARASRQRGDAAVDLALLTDGLRAEREQGITIDVAYRYFATPRRKFIIADTPGHIQYTRNMVTGASTAELAIVLVDARKGVVTQSRRHGFLAALLQIPHIVVAVNKMDLVDFREEVYRDIVDEYSAFAARLAVRGLDFIPISALLGDNVVNESAHMPWYRGPSLVHFLENVQVGATRNVVDFRFPVQLALRPHQGFRGFAGLVASGTIAPGEEIAVLPSGRTSRVRTIVAGDEVVPVAEPGASVVLTLEDEIDVSRGDMIVRRSSLPQVADALECVLCWLGEEPLNPQRGYWLQHTTRQVRAFVTDVAYRIDVDTLQRELADTLQLNEIGHVHIHTAQPLFYDPYVVNRATGSFILVDPFSHNTVAAGLIRRRAAGAAGADEAGRWRQVRGHVGELDETHLAQGANGKFNGDHPAGGAPARNVGRSSNVVWQGTPITREERATRNGHQAAVLWFTGLSGAGKSTLAHLLERRLFALGCQTFALDGDNVRHGLNGDLGFAQADRQENIRRVAEVARLAFDHGQIALCTFISPLAADRDRARALLPAGRFLEIHVRCDLEECRRRDPKGLYERALRGEIADFTGVSAPYEEPVNPELVVDTGRETPETIVETILGELVRRAIIMQKG
jgi:bifunctional enzyme CysN/CysC